MFNNLMALEDILGCNSADLKNKISGFIPSALLLILLAIATVSKSAPITSRVNSMYNGAQKKYDKFIGSPVQQTCWNITRAVLATYGSDACEDPRTGDYVDLRVHELTVYNRELLAGKHEGAKAIIENYNGNRLQLWLEPEDTSTSHWVYHVKRVEMSPITTGAPNDQNER
jgi:hypothetical protein